MEIINTPLKDCLIIKQDLYVDSRGFLMEFYNQKKMDLKGIDFEVKQINFAKSQGNVLRGLHYQEAPFSQAKLVGVISGSVLDVVVDLRKDSATFLQHFKLEIGSPETLLYIPKGFAHGYKTLKDDTVFYYAVDEFYNPEFEKGLIYNDKTLAIDWGDTENAIISLRQYQHK
jgi:dTDP-4-dehydrorhamnose 3,5-epimerase